MKEKLSRVWNGFLKTKKGIACMAAAALVLLGGLSWGIYEIWRYQQPKFQDVTVELGTESVHVTQFMTRYARLNRVAFVSDLSVIDLNHTGQTQVTLRHGSQEETVTFRVEDTTAPEVRFVTSRTETGAYLPNAEDFVESVTDADDTTIAFAQEVAVPADYSDVACTVVVTDSSGNATRQECTLSFEWIRESVALEYGQTLTKEDLLLAPEVDGDLINQEDIDRINQSPLGSYTIESTTDVRTEACTVTVQDTLGPELVLEEICIYPGDAVEAADFVVSASDASGDVTLTMKTQPDNQTLGTQQITVEAADIYGNITAGEVTLRVSTDRTKPEIEGLNAILRVERSSQPDYLAGVSAVDETDGICTVIYDDSDVNIDESGTYYVIYTATDLSGNTAREKRKIQVIHNPADTQALLEKHGAKLSDDPEEIRNYVRRNIHYSHDWGGEDPVWYGFTNRRGNCYVHALCLKAMLELKGHETQLIWVEDKSHYWVIIKIGDVWRHIDATPSNGYHDRYSLMTDAQRAATLSGREWDRSQWPACE